MKTLSKIFLSTLALTAFTACGGGGGDSGSSGQDNKNISQNAAKVFATFELSIVTLSHKHSQNLSVLLENLKTVAASTSNSVTLNCLSSGNATATVTKASPHNGLSAGDQVLINYSGCALGNANSIWTGQAKITVQSTISPLSQTAAFDADLMALSNKQANVTSLYNGKTNINLKTGDVGSAVESTFSIPAASQLKVSEVVQAQPPIVSITYKANTVLISKYTRSIDSTNLSLQLDGPLAFASQGFDSEAQGLAFTFSTPAAWTSTNSILSPTAGQLNLKVAPPPSEGSPIVFSVAPNNGKARITVDSNNNGTADLTFDLPWSELIGV
jgi:hypothetical protein